METNEKLFRIELQETNLNEFELIQLQELKKQVKTMLKKIEFLERKKSIFKVEGIATIDTDIFNENTIGDYVGYINTPSGRVYFKKNDIKKLYKI